MKNFEELGVSPEIRKAIKEMGYENPMPVQEKVVPYLLGENNDVVALAQTGTGKTAAFGLPIIQKVNIDKRVPQSLVLCPTRELCLQIAGDLHDYSKYIDGLKVIPVYGGSSIESQIRSLKRGVHIIVATPGRLLDLMKRRTVSLSTISNVVMDEADEMLNMGFTESINAILADVPKNRNTLLFSATMSPEVARIAKNYLNNPKEITIGRKNESTSNVNHVVYRVHARDKFAALKRIVDFNPDIYGIVFCRTRRETQQIADQLVAEGYSADAIHGELSQPQRDAVMQKFRVKNIQLLIATDVAARGLDVDDLTHVINFSLPDETESYTHRSGRTGRAGKTGTSIAIINMREQGKLREIERIIGKKFEMEDLPTGESICEKQLLKVIGEIEKVKVNEEEIAKFLPEIYRKLDWLTKEDIIKRVVSLEFNRFLEYYEGKDDLQAPREEQKRGRDRDRRGSQAGFTRLFINLGKTDNFFPNELIALLNQNTKSRVELGKIDLMRNFSFFEVEDRSAEAVLGALNNAKWGDREVVVEVAGEEAGGGSSRGGRSRSNNTRRGRSDRNDRSNRSDRPSSSDRRRPSREDRGYTAARGPKSNNKKREFKGETPDFSEEGWARRHPRKK